MAVGTERLVKLLDQASMDLVMLSANDLVEVSAFLGLVENLGREFVRFESEWPPRVVNGIKSLLKAVIRDEIPDRVKEAMEVAGEGVTHLTELARALAADREPVGDLRGFLKRSAALTGQEFVAPPEPAAPPKAEPGPEAPPPPEEVIPLAERGSDWNDIDKGWGDEGAREAGAPSLSGDGAGVASDGASPADGGADAGSDGASPADDGDDAGSEGASPPDGGAEAGSDGASPPEGGEHPGSDAASPARGAELAGSDAASPSDGGEYAGSDGASPSDGGEYAGSDGASPDDGGEYAGSDGASPSDGGEYAGSDAASPAGEGPAPEAGTAALAGEGDLAAARKAAGLIGPPGRRCFLGRREQPPEALSADCFRQDFVRELESLQMRLVAVEQKNDPAAAMGECVPDFKTIQTGFSLLGLDDLTFLTSDTLALMDYVITEHVPHSTQITDILLKSLGFLIGGVSTLEVTADGISWSFSPTWTQEELALLRDDLWNAGQGMLAPEPPTAVQSTSGASRGAKPKRLGEILVEKGLISEGDLGGLIQAQKTARNVRLGEILLEDGLISEEELQEALDAQAAEAAEGGSRRLGEILVSQGRLDHEHVEKALKIQESRKETKLGEILLQKKIGAPEKVAAALREQKLSENLSQPTVHPAGVHTVKVETQKLDGLIDLVGELVITQSLVTSNESLKGLKEQKINKDLAQVSRITSELQRNAMSLRMVVIKNTFQKMRRLVRDLAHKFEKELEFTTQGDDTEIDRNMVESIYDPLVHMVRNAMDHGIEPPDQRRAAGKPIKGTLVLKAYHQGGNVVIELSDDGRGLDVAKVQSKAEELGMVQPGEVLTTAQAHSIIFQPGFSTADRVSEISGRGVGMDVVRKSIEQLRGKVDFSSVPGQGSNFVIRLPLTLAIIDGMIVRVGDNRYILPTISINESFRPKPEEYFTVKNQGEMIKVRDNLLPLVRLDQIVNADGAVRDPSDALVVVVENEGQRRCLLVDEVLGKQEVVIKSLGERLKYVRSLAGGTILGDGRVGLILDVNGLFDVGAGGFGPPSQASSSSADAGDWDM